jgi:hypothetical protein
MSRPGSEIPDAWPKLLSRAQAAAYIGVSEATFTTVCPVAPVDLGVHVLRWNRAHVDEWLDNLPARLRKPETVAHGEQAAPAPLEQEPGPVVDRKSDALARVRRRGGGTWRESHTSSASGRTAA